MKGTGSGGWIRTNDQAVNSRPLCQLSYAGTVRKSVVSEGSQRYDSIGLSSDSHQGDALRLEEVFQFPAARGVTQLAQRLGFDLADALARDVEFPAHLFQRPAPAVVQAEAQA